MSHFAMKDFGQNLARYRTKQGYTHAAFSEKTGVHVTNLSKYERGKSTPTLEVAEKLAQGLGVTIDELIYGPSAQRAESQLSDEQLLRLFTKTQDLDEHHRRTALELLDAFILKANLAKQLA